ncbi:dihydrodipicolinate synthase family protein [Sinorhizobium sp. 7-81]|uniref:dihydrodipicolinate synthase family protein n=1 Tax=Sinorhizobium sp. 8-89 TaxID=3049089 RepID=UPI0024C23F3B|nr:dihydrodipicolinate synthase family protein [Sinorhizobium sp. 8-89]MDK1494661.1 dihydrodipicolinate synthase family protein [Sinorhizobium sp. 8-89]
MQIPQLSGILTALATPYHNDGLVDLKALDKLVEFLVSNGVHALVPGGSTGEYYSQTVEERKAVLTRVAEVVQGSVPLYVGSNSMRPEETIELAKFAEGLGYGAQLLAAPPYSLPGKSELIAHFRNIAERTSLPIILYNFPARTGVDMDKEFLEGVLDIKKIFAIKESSGSISRYYEHMLLYPELQRVCGFDDQVLDQFLWGTRSWIAGASNFLPAEHVALYNTCVKKEDFLLGRKLMKLMMPLIYLLENGGKFNQYIKYGASLAGVPIGDVRAPLIGLSDAERLEFRTLYEDLKSQNIASWVN